MSDNARRTGPALEAHYRFLEWLIPTVEKFPRSQKFLLGDRLQQAALDVLEDLIEATYTRQRRAPLDSANLGLEKLRFFFRLGVDLKYLDTAALRARGPLPSTKPAGSSAAGSGPKRPMSARYDTKSG